MRRGLESAGRRLMTRLDEFAAFTDEAPRLTRLYLSDAHRRATARYTAWARESGLEARIDPSGAGHDTMIMGRLCPAGMLFVRCKGGVSHNPSESISPEDCEIALAALMRFVKDFRAG
jgi:acetylornithine deacetylase/succinyl-diaminopimelate desuccinylase-like protein